MQRAPRRKLTAALEKAGMLKAEANEKTPLEAN